MGCSRGSVALRAESPLYKDEKFDSVAHVLLIQRLLSPSERDLMLTGVCGIKVLNSSLEG